MNKAMESIRLHRFFVRHRWLPLLPGPPLDLQGGEV